MPSVELTNVEMKWLLSKLAEMKSSNYRAAIRKAIMEAK